MRIMSSKNDRCLCSTPDEGYDNDLGRTIERSGSDDEVAQNAVAYMYGISYNEAGKMMKNLSPEKIQYCVEYFYQRDLPYNERKKLKDPDSVKASTVTNNEGETWELVRRKMVYDSDGFTDYYSMYVSEDGETYVMVFGDPDYYEPSYYDNDMLFEGPNAEAEAQAWFDSYGNEDDDDDDGIYSATDVDVDDSLKDYIKSITKVSGCRMEFVPTFSVRDLQSTTARNKAGKLKAALEKKYGKIEKWNFAESPCYAVFENPITDHGEDVYSSTAVKAGQPGRKPAAWNENYRGYKIRLDTRKGCYCIYDKNGEMEDCGFKSKEDCHPAIDKLIDGCSQIHAADEEAEEEILEQLPQEFTSENTSINFTKTPAVFRLVNNWAPGTINLDYGGGRADTAAEYLAQYEVINLVYDPYNRSAEHNKEVVRLCRQNGGADTATCSNVLNVIKEAAVRLSVLNNIKKLVKPGGTVYITVYEGTGRGDEGPTKSGYQLNKKTADYMDEVLQVFPDAKRKGKLIIATNSGAVKSSVTAGADPNTTVDTLKTDLYNAASAVMQSPEYGFPAEEVDGYLFIDVADMGQEIRAEVRAELSYDGMIGLADKLNPIVQKLDKEAYFDMEEPGIMSAFIRKTEITSSWYSDPEPSLEPPEPTSTEVDDVTEELTLEFENVVAIVDEVGMWEYEEGSWNSSDLGENVDFDSETYPGLKLADSNEIIEYIDQLIEYYMPSKPGRYKISGKAVLSFDITGVFADVEHLVDEDGEGYTDEEYYTDDARVEFNDALSHVDDFKFEEV